MPSAKTQPAGQSIGSPAGKQPEPGGDIPRILDSGCSGSGPIGRYPFQARKRFRAAIPIVTATPGPIHPGENISKIFANWPIGLAKTLLA